MEINKESNSIAVLQGGFESERYASCLTGQNIANALLSAGYKRVNSIDVGYDIVDILMEAKPDFAFLSMFCKWGEDGVIQSLLEVMRIPYSGSGVEASALCNNKYFFTKFAESCGISVPQTALYSNVKDLLKDGSKFVYPCITKPVYQGYSLGVSLVKDESEIEEAALSSFSFSTKTIVQEYIDGREFTVGVLDTFDKGSIILPIIELKLKRPIQNVEVKEDSGLVEEVIPAELSTEERNVLEEQTLRLYNAIGCLGVSRFDVRYKRETRKFYFLENNTCPGILNYIESDLPKQLLAAGISLEDFVSHMIYSGLNRPATKLDYVT